MTHAGPAPRIFGPATLAGLGRVVHFLSGDELHQLWRDVACKSKETKESFETAREGTVRLWQQSDGKTPQESCNEESASD